MSARLPSDLLVGAMMRRVQQAGGYATVLAKGDAQAGSVLALGSSAGLTPIYGSVALAPMDGPS